MLYKFLRNAVKPLCFALFFLKHKGRENEPKNGSYILCCNHLSLLDPVFLAVILKRKIRYMGKKEAFSSKFLAWLYTNIGMFPVDRHNPDIKAIKTSLKILKTDEVLGIFPEGTRVKSQGDGIANMGVGLFAAKSKASILPARVLTKDSKLKLFRSVKVVFGKPITFEELNLKESSNEEYTRISKQILDTIYSLKW